MLVLSRRLNEGVVVRGDVTVTVVGIRGDKVRLAVTAPASVPVHRQEVYQAILGTWPPVRPRPPGEDAFLRAIGDDPADETTRLVFADWLEERGDPLGEFVRAQCLLKRLPAGDPRRETLKRRRRALWGEHAADWTASLPSVLWT